MLEASKRPYAEITEAKTVSEGYIGSYLLYHIKLKHPTALTEEANQVEIIERRYNDFECFHTKMKELYKAELLPALPEKKFLKGLSHNKGEFNKVRHQDLELYINKILTNKHLMSLEEVRLFFSNVHLLGNKLCLLPELWGH